VRERRPRALLLDFYGTVVHEDHDIISEICGRVAVASPLGIGAAEVRTYWGDTYRRLCATSHGPTFQTQRELTQRSLRRILEQFQAELDVEAISQPLYSYWTRPTPFAESVEVLAGCDVPVCLVSNIDNADLSSALAHTGLHFEHIVTSQTCRAYKPRGEMFARALSLLNARPEEALHVGDSLGSDVRGARAAGIRVLWVNRNGRKAPSGDGAPDWVSRDLRGLLQILTGLR
jgi:2-haloalkanoic acid dehalogenase type II